MASKIGKTGWLTLYATAGIIDFVQLLIGFFSVPLSAIAIGVVLIAINEAADPFIGGALIIWLEIRGVSVITKINRVISLIGTAAIEEATNGIAPFWIVDIWYIHRDVKEEEAQAKEIQKQELLLDNPRQRFYEDGVGKPRGKGGTAEDSRKFTSGGIGRPRPDW